MRRAKYLGHRCVAVTDKAYARLVAIAEEEQRRTGLFVSLTTVASRLVLQRPHGTTSHSAEPQGPNRDRTETE